MPADECRRMWVPGSPVAQLEMVKRRLVKAGHLGRRAGPGSWRKDALIRTEPLPTRRQREKAKAPQSRTSPRKEESWCWDTQVARLKTPGALSRTQPSPYSSIPAILMVQHAHRLKRLIESQVTAFPLSASCLLVLNPRTATRSSFVHSGPCAQQAGSRTARVQRGFNNMIRGVRAGGGIAQ
jgi:hypothetical protein